MKILNFQARPYLPIVVLGVFAVALSMGVLFAFQAQARPLDLPVTLTKTDNKDTANPGDTSTYEITLTGGHGDYNCYQNSSVVDTLPSHFTVNPASITHDGTYDNTANTITWDLEEFDGRVCPEDILTFSFSGTIDSNMPNGSTTLTNQVEFQTQVLDIHQADYQTIKTATDQTTVYQPYCGDNIKNGSEQCDGTDGVGENQSCTTQCTLESKIAPGAPSLSLTKIVDKALVNPDNTLNYTIVVSNSGQAVAVNVALTDTLPAGLTYLDDQNKNTGETTKTWTWPLLEAGKDVTVKYAVHVDSQATAKNYTNTALVKADNFSPAVSASATTEVRIPTVLGDEAPALTIDKVVDRAFANPGDTVLYTVKVTNTGNTPAINAVLTDVLPTGLVFVDSSTTTATWKLGDIVPTESVTKTYKVKLDGSLLAGAYANSATVKADNVDPLTTQVSLNVREVQVLGAEDEVKVLGAELPDTGAGLLGVLAGLLLLGSGLVISRKTK